MWKLVVLGVAALTVTLAGVAVAAPGADTYTYRATLTPGAEVPKPKAPAGARGTFNATVAESGTTATIRWTLTFRGLSGKAVAAHIHKGKPGIAGTVLVPLCTPCTSGKKGTKTITKTVAELLERGRAYVNVHTAKNAAGEIRGQVKLTGKTSDVPSDDDGGGTGGGSDGGSDGEAPPGY